MKSFERLVAQELGRMAGPEPRVDAMGIARAVAARAPKRRSLVTSGALKLVTTGVIVAAISAFLFTNGIVGLPVGPDQPPPMGSAPESSVPSARPTVTPARSDPTSRPDLDKLASEPFDWTRIDLPHEAGVWNSIATLPTGEILLLGRRGREHTAYGWLSTDGGRTWVRHGIGAAADFDHEPDQLVVWDDMFVIAGTDHGTGVVLTSTDGVTWTKAAEIERAVFWRLTALPDGLAIVGRSLDKRTKGDRRSYGDNALFTSTDATDWQTHRLPGAGEQTARSDAGVSLVTSNPTGHDGTLSRSEDGETWTQVDLPMPPGTGGYVHASALAWAPSGFVLGLYRDGASRYPTGSIWHSDDGLTWERVADTVGQVNQIDANDRSYVAFPRTGDPEVPSEEQVLALRSTDGREWTMVAGIDRHVADAAITADGRVLAMVDGDGGAPIGSYVTLLIGEPN